MNKFDNNTFIEKILQLIFYQRDNIQRNNFGFLQSKFNELNNFANQSYFAELINSIYLFYLNDIQAYQQEAFFKELTDSLILYSIREYMYHTNVPITDNALQQIFNNVFEQINAMQKKSYVYAMQMRQSQQPNQFSTPYGQQFQQYNNQVPVQQYTGFNIPNVSLVNNRPSTQIPPQGNMMQRDQHNVMSKLNKTYEIPPQNVNTKRQEVSQLNTDENIKEKIKASPDFPIKVIEFPECECDDLLTMLKQIDIISRRYQYSNDKVLSTLGGYSDIRAFTLGDLTDENLELLKSLKNANTIDEIFYCLKEESTHGYPLLPLIDDIDDQFNQIFHLCYGLLTVTTNDISAFSKSDIISYFKNRDFFINNAEKYKDFYKLDAYMFSYIKQLFSGELVPIGTKEEIFDSYQTVFTNNIIHVKVTLKHNYLKNDIAVVDNPYQLTKAAVIKILIKFFESLNNPSILIPYVIFVDNANKLFKVFRNTNEPHKFSWIRIQ